ncbi:MAG: hypothetical protein ACLSHJ_06890 [Oscillospiraceae bacterium]
MPRTTLPPRTRMEQGCPCQLKLPEMAFFGSGPLMLTGSMSRAIMQG